MPIKTTISFIRILLNKYSNPHQVLFFDIAERTSQKPDVFTRTAHFQSKISQKPD
jgi:hypothetical protein